MGAKLTADSKTSTFYSFDKQAEKFFSLPFSEILGESFSTLGKSR